jgi:hypothetical protein
LQPVLSSNFKPNRDMCQPCDARWSFIRGARSSPRALSSGHVLHFTSSRNTSIVTSCSQPIRVRRSALNCPESLGFQMAPSSTSSHRQSKSLETSHFDRGRLQWYERKIQSSRCQRQCRVRRSHHSVCRWDLLRSPADTGGHSLHPKPRRNRAYVEIFQVRFQLKLTHFTSGEIFDFDASADHEHMFPTRRQTKRDVVLLSDFRHQ